MEAAECGVACLTMLLAYYGQHSPLSEVRQVCGTSRDGNSASDLLRGAKGFGLTGRGMRTPLGRLGKLRTPAILHWDLNHFVILERVRRRSIQIVDPATGRREVPFAEVDRLFSGIALELWPAPGFVRRKARSISYARYRQVLAKCRGAIAFVVVANLAGQLLALSVPAASQVLIDHVILPDREQWLLPVLALMLLGAIGQVVLSRLQGASQAVLRGTLSVELTTELGRHILGLPLPFLDSRGHGDLFSRVQLQGELQGLVATTAQGAFDVLSLLFLGALLLAYDARLGGLVLLLLLLRVVVIQRCRGASEQRVAAVLSARGRERGALAEASSCPELIKGLGVEQGVAERYARIVTERAGLAIRSERLQKAIAAWLAVLSGAMEALILWVGGNRVIDGHMTIGVFAGFLAVRALLQAPLSSLLGLFESWISFRSALERSDEILSVPLAPPASVRPGPRQGRLEARNLGFRYGSGGAWVLRHVDLVVEPGQHVVFVGPSGQGKSTLLRLLCGLLEPSEGEVLLDGAPIGALEASALARRLGVVLQEPLILEGSVNEALRLRIPDATPAHLQQAARAACFEETVRRLPGGYEAEVAAFGANLSGGERQRLALAQALVATPDVLVLDEATCSLDPDTEARVLYNLHGAGVTIVSAAHRHSVLAYADRVFAVMNLGIVPMQINKSAFAFAPAAQSGAPA